MNTVAPGATRTATNGSFFEAPGPAELIAGTTAFDRLGGPDDVTDAARASRVMTKVSPAWAWSRALSSSGRPASEVAEKP